MDFVASDEPNHANIHGIIEKFFPSRREFPTIICEVSLVLSIQREIYPITKLARTSN
jgi:hypothetical protein